MKMNNPENESKEISDYIQKLSKEELDKVLVIPVCIAENPYKHFGICDPEGKIDLERIERIRETQYYKHYRSFRNYHELDGKEKDDKFKYFFGTYDSHTEYEDHTYVEQGIKV